MSPQPQPQPQPQQPQPDLESQPQPPQPQPKPDLESQPQPPPPPPTQPQPPQQNLQWQDLIKFFLPSAVAIALKSTQTESQLPLSLHLLSLTVILSFSTLFVANLISSKFEDRAKELEKAATFFLITAFFLAISIAMPVSLKFFSWTMYGVLLLTAYKFR